MIADLGLDNPKAVAEFVDLFRRYNTELEVPPEINLDKWSTSILQRLREPDRWLLIARGADGRALGFSLFKIDHDERRGLGYIMEFFVSPESRRQGLGRRLLQRSCDLLSARGACQVWLASSARAEGFWAKCGFRANGEHERHQRVMIRTLAD